MNFVIYTDGACTNNGKQNSKGGIGLYCQDQLHVSRQIKSSKITNNVCELTAILEALLWVETHMKDIESVEICTDSSYSIQCVTSWIHGWKQNNWRTAANKPVKNKRLIVTIYETLQRLQPQVKISFRYVSNHDHRVPPEDCQDQDWVGNYKADRLASQACLDEQASTTEWNGSLL